MAYFIVIGTSNDVKCVVDEIKRAHLQHNVVTSGCVVSEDDGLFYHWDVFNAEGVKTDEKRESIVLHDALTNQISQFKVLLSGGAIPNVFVVSRCFDEKECGTLRMVCDELYKVGGAILSSLLVDIVLIGYDLNHRDNVTLRPHWRMLESLRGLGANAPFHTDILYINNMDYMGAATNVGYQMLGKFLSHWSKMISSGGSDLKAGVYSNVYSIGISEHQYDFRDLNEFFSLAAEERLLDRKLNNQPSVDTQELLNTNYYRKIDIDAPWIDGLCAVQKDWKEYCTEQWNPSRPLSEHPYSVAKQELTIASYLDKYLKLYIAEERREISALQSVIAQKESEITLLKAQIAQLESERIVISEKLEELKSVAFEESEELLEDSEKGKRLLEEQATDKDKQIRSIGEQLSLLDDEIEVYRDKIKVHEENIRQNTFIDADAFQEQFGIKTLITDEDEEEYAVNKESVERLSDYVKSETGIKVMREAVKRATVADKLPDSYPVGDVQNIGHLVPVEPALVIPVAVVPDTDQSAVVDNLAARPGCLSWFKGLFSGKKDNNTEPAATEPAPSDSPKFIASDASASLNEALDKSVAALRKADEVRAWWKHLCGMIELYQKRQTECRLLMDGEKDLNGDYVVGKEGYRPEKHSKSVSLIDMDRVRNFRDTDAYYKGNVDKFLNRWFDKSTEPEKRMTMPELIKHQVLDPLVGKFHTLHWDGSNPFVNELLSDEELHEIIEADIKQSKPFVEYVRIQATNLTSAMNIRFFSNNKSIQTDPSTFRNRYQIGTDSITPVFLGDFANSLCVVQVMGVPDYVDSIRDFKPKREAQLSRLKTDIRADVAAIIGQADSAEQKARAIYDWLCDNIAYDTTKQIHDAETCYRLRRGVCQAYCELFCYMAEAVGLTADIIVGKTKNPDGVISEEKHAWVFVYTHAYDGILIDPTWGAGAVDGVKFVRNSDSSTWFDVSPYWLIFSHFPDDGRWTKLDLKITEEQFEQISYATPATESDGKDFFIECLSKTLKSNLILTNPIDCKMQC